MSSTSTSTGNGFDVVVGGGGTLSVPAAELARHGVAPGAHLRVVPASDAPEREGSRPAPRRKLRGLLVGKIPAEDILTWEDFEATHRANVAAAERRYGVLDA
jgi:hypothetical protein